MWKWFLQELRRGLLIGLLVLLFLTVCTVVYIIEVEKSEPTPEPTRMPQPTRPVATRAPTATPFFVTRVPTSDLSEFSPTFFPAAECSGLGGFTRMSKAAKVAVWNAAVTAQDRAVARQAKTGRAPDYRAIDEQIARRFGISLKVLACIDYQAQKELWPFP